MSSLKYLRKFIILEPTEPTIKIKGYSKIEIRDGRGKIEVNLDGISDKDKGYDVILLTEEGLKSDVANFGTIYEDGNGKVSYKKDFNPKNVLHSDKSIDDYNIIAVKHSNDEILYGHIHRANNDKDIKSLLVEEAKKEEEIDGQIDDFEVEEEPEVNLEGQVNYEPEVEEEYEDFEEEIDFQKDDGKEEIYEEVEIENNELYQQEAETNNIDDEESPEEIEPQVEVEDQGKIEEEHDSEVEVKHEEEYNFDEYDYEEPTEGLNYPNADDKLEEYYLKKSQKDLEEYRRYQEYKSKENIDNYNNQYGYSINNNSEENINSQMEGYSLNILNYFNEVEPFKNNLKGYRFWEITEDSVNIRRGFLPYYNYVVNMHYPYTIMNRMTTASRQIRKYRHYLFGIVSSDDQDIDHFVYGIPGRFSRQEQPYRGMSGFTTWLEKAHCDKEDKLGYWLIHIDAKTGRIITPLRPTNPL